MVTGVSHGEPAGEPSRLSTYIPLREIARFFPKNRYEKHPSLSQLYRWTTTGKRGVVLESWTVGTQRCTTHEAVQRFIADLSATYRPPRPPSSRDAERQAQIAGERLRTTVFAKRRRPR
jgi:hypothetical protein